MERIKIRFVDNSEKVIFDDFIYNRFDKQKRNEFQIIEIWDGKSTRYIQVLLDDTKATLGVWLLDFSRKQLHAICKLVFKRFRYIKTISIPFSCQKIGNYIKKNHYDITINSPNMPEHLTSRKHWREILKQKNRLFEMLGNEEFVDYNSSCCPEEVMDYYYLWKKTTHNIEYKLSAFEYFKKYHVTNVYALFYGSRIVSVLLSCEQCSKVYIENISYDICYRDFSPGKLIYIKYIEALYKKGFRQLYLGGGDYEYKTYYGSTKRECYICTVKRHLLSYLPLFMKKFLKKIMRRS